MIKDLPQIVLAIAFAAPLLAAAVMGMLPRTQRRRLTYWPGIAGALLSVVAGLAAVSLMRDSGVVPVQPLRLFRWITLANGTAISFTWQLDALSVLFLILTGIATSFALISTAEANVSGPSRRPSPAVGISLMHSCVVLLLLAADWLTFYWAWVLMSVTAGLLVMMSRRSDAGGPAASRELLPICIANGVILCGLPLYWEQFSTFDYQAVHSTIDVAASEGQAAPWPLWTIGLCLLAGVVGRCSLFPLAIDWTQSKTCSAVAVLEPALLFPAGLYLAARALVLLSADSPAGLFVMLVGALTALIGAVDAAVQFDLQRRLQAVAVSLCGMTILGLGTMTPVGCTAALCLAAGQTVAMAGLWLASSSVKQGRVTAAVRWAIAANGVVICSGIWGQHAILAAVAATSQQITESWAAGIVRAAYWVAMASLPCLSFALVAAFCRLPADDKAQQGTVSRWLLWISPIAAGGVAPAILMLPAPLDVTSALRLDGVASVGFESLPLIDVGLPLVLLGAVAAWWRMSSSPSDALHQPKGLLHWLQTCCGLPQLWSLVVGSPIRIAAGICRVVDAVVLAPALNALPRILCQIPARVAGSMQTGHVQFCLLSVLLATALLLFLLAGRGS